MKELTFNIKDFLVGSYTASYERYNLYFSEYHIPAEHESEIAEVKASDIKYYELADGSIHFSQVRYENIFIQAVE